MELGSLEELIERRKKGVLKIYLGYAAGVGKTFAMLQEAQRLKKRGLDVVVGYLEPHDRAETLLQAEGLEEVPRKIISVAGREFPELDVDAVIRRKPQIVLIDELAHSNVAGSKHEKRYEDVLEILEHQINVLSTLNIQHVETVAERVAQLTHIEVHERIPDNLLQRADQIVNVDVTIQDLRERLRTGKIYIKDRAEQALQNFFTPQNLSVLREACLREAAEDQVRKIGESDEELRKVTAGSQEAVMLCMSSDPTSAATLIRKGTRLAMQLSTRCYAVYVQSSKEAPTVIDAGLQRKLQNNLKLAKSMGAEVVTLKSDDVANALVNFAHEHYVLHAVFGKTRISPFKERIKGSVVSTFIHDSVGIDVHIVCTGKGM